MNDLELAVIHDVKNKLGEVVFRLEARGDCFDEIESLIHSSNSLTNLILWHRQQGGSMHVNVDSASPSDLLDEITIEFRRFFPKLVITCDLSHAPVFWFYDANYIRLALVNALHNACRFAKSRVWVRVLESAGKLVVTIKDDGAGYGEQLLQRFAGGEFAEPSSGGTGVGLLLASSIADMHVSKGVHGQVVLKNDSGAVFEMTLP